MNDLIVKVIKVDSNFRRIEVNNIPIIGISKIKDGWECDTNCREFKTIAEAKSYAIKYFDQFK